MLCKRIGEQQRVKAFKVSLPANCLLGLAVTLLSRDLPFTRHSNFYYIPTFQMLAEIDAVLQAVLKKPDGIFTFYFRFYRPLSSSLILLGLPVLCTHAPCC